MNLGRMIVGLEIPCYVMCPSCFNLTSKIHVSSPSSTDDILFISTLFSPNIFSQLYFKLNSEHIHIREDLIKFSRTRSQLHFSYIISILSLNILYLKSEKLSFNISRDSFIDIFSSSNAS